MLRLLSVFASTGAPDSGGLRPPIPFTNSFSHARGNMLVAIWHTTGRRIVRERNRWPLSSSPSRLPSAARDRRLAPFLIDRRSALRARPPVDRHLLPEPRRHLVTPRSSLASDQLFLGFLFCVDDSGLIQAASVLRGAPTSATERR